MPAAPLPLDEAQRLEALRRYAILDSEAEAAFDELTSLASDICQTPIALVSLIDEGRQWFKSRVGLDVTETPRELAFCAHAILQEQVFEVADAVDDERFAANPLVTGDPNIRFYAGAPLVTNDGFKLGTLCVIDRVPRSLTPSQRRALEVLGRQVLSQIELRRTVASLARNVLDLRTAREALKHADSKWRKTGERTRSEFLAQATHDLRTPLNAILGYAELLLDDDDDDDPALAIGSEAAVILTKVVEAGGHMLRLVNDILDIGRLEAQHLAIETLDVDLAQIARSVVETMRPQVLTNQNRVSLDIGEGLGPIRSDPVRIRQTLFNLMSNACKFTYAGSIELKIRAQADDWLTIEVSDSGIGMSAEELGRLFRPFVQVQEVPTSAGQSTGLGLVLTRALCERLGGSLEVRSERGVGSTFTITLPRELPEEATGGTVAVVESSGQNRGFLTRTLRRWRVRPVFYPTVAAVLWSAGDRRIDAVIIDRGGSSTEAQLLKGLVAIGRTDGVALVEIVGANAGPENEGIARWRRTDGLEALRGLLGIDV